MHTKVLMVCLGNICRSPLAEGILKSKTNSEHIFVDSAGTAGYHVGNQPDPRSIAIAQKYGIDISQQRCRKFSAKDFQQFDRIYVMDKSNYTNVTALAATESEQTKVKLLLDEVDLATNEVPDPYYGGADGFNDVFHLISKACDAIALDLDPK